MESRRLQTPPILLAVYLLASATVVWAQTPQVTVATPLHTTNDSFFEHRGVSWGARGPNWFASFGSPNMSAPGFGGFSPGAGMSFGGGFRGNGVNGYFNGNFSQGHRSSFMSQTPRITLQNGMPGGFSDSSLSPFVMGYTPIVGGWPTVSAPLVPGGGSGYMAVRDRLYRARRGEAPATMGQPPPPVEAPAPVLPRVAQHVNNDGDDLVLVAPGVPASTSLSLASSGMSAGSSTAGRPAISVAEAKRLRAAELAVVQEEAAAFFERGLGAEAAGKENVARMYYQHAARHATGPLREQILERLSIVQGAKR